MSRIETWTIAALAFCYAGPAFADGGGPPGVVYDVSIGGTQVTQAIAWPTREILVAGKGLGDGKTLVVKLPRFEKLEVDGARYTFYVLGKDDKLAKFSLRDVIFMDQVLFKDAGVCRAPQKMVMKLSPKKRANCPEVVVDVSDRDGDWHPCAIGYQPSNRKACPNFGNSNAFFVASKGIEPISYSALR